MKVPTSLLVQMKKEARSEEDVRSALITAGYDLDEIVAALRRYRWLPLVRWWWVVLLAALGIFLLAFFIWNSAQLSMQEFQVELSRSVVGNSTADCLEAAGRLDDAGQRDGAMTSCLTIHAVRERDSALCDGITESDRRMYCQKETAYAALDPSMCEGGCNRDVKQLRAIRAREAVNCTMVSCNVTIAALEKDPALCGFDGCRMIAYRNVSGCREDRCVLAIALLEQRADYCSASSDPVGCSGTIAMVYHDYSYCAWLGKDSPRCEFQVTADGTELLLIQPLEDRLERVLYLSMK